MFKLLFNGITSILANLLSVICWPINQIITGVLPNFSDKLTYITDNLFNVSYTAPVTQTERTEKYEAPSYSRKLVSSNTTQTDKVLARYTSMGAGSPDVVESVNSGFSNLINKLEEMSSRQDKTEEMLKMIAIPSGTSAYRY